jgi:hypothetical protein
MATLRTEENFVGFKPRSHNNFIIVGMSVQSSSHQKAYRT